MERMGTVLTNSCASESRTYMTRGAKHIPVTTPTNGTLAYFSKKAFVFCIGDQLPLEVILVTRYLFVRSSYAARFVAAAVRPSPVGGDPTPAPTRPLLVELIRFLLLRSAL